MSGQRIKAKLGSTAVTLAPWIFSVLGGFWLLFHLLSCWGDVRAFMIQASVTAGPFFVCALLVSRFPRLVGVTALAAALGEFLFFDLFTLFGLDSGALVVFLLLVFPLVVAGTALLVQEQ